MKGNARQRDTKKPMVLYVPFMRRILSRPNVHCRIMLDFLLVFSGCRVRNVSAFGRESRAPTFHPVAVRLLCRLRTPIPLAVRVRRSERWDPSLFRRLSAQVRYRSRTTRFRLQPRPAGRESGSPVDQPQRAPVGMSPVSVYRQSAITSLRATAIIITRRARPFASPQRSWNHLLKGLSG